MAETSKTHLLKLKEITTIILDAMVDFLELKNALTELKLLFAEVAEFDFTTEENLESIHLEMGKALAPAWAGSCIDDIIRTKRFICGIDKAIQDTRKKKKNEPVTILYCGTGPFATLVMPLITKYLPHELQFILLEVNPVSLQNVKKLINGFDAEAYVKEYHLADATKFKLPLQTHTDILVVECLQHALIREPQVAITYNLLPQLPAEVILIPQEIKLQLAVINAKAHQDYLMGGYDAVDINIYESVAPVFTINKEEVFLKSEDEQVLHFSPLEVTFSAIHRSQNNFMAITTEIGIYKEEKLGFNESGLTLPLQFGTFDGPTPVRGVITQYIIGDYPHLETTLMR